MSSGKESPRQKMIGMMYLVLTALLALNVSKDILDAFVVVNKGLETTNDNFTARNENLYAEFDLAKSIDPVRVTPNWKLAQAVKTSSSELTDYIDKLQNQLVASTDKIELRVADTLQMADINSKDNFDTPTNILIGESEDGSAGASRELKNKLIAYREQLRECILPEDKKNVKLDINTDDPERSLTNENWELYNFYHRPLVASVTILSKLKNDIKNAESIVVDYLLKQNDTEVMKFDTIAAKVIPKSNYVLLGEEYKADVFIAAFSKTKKPEVLVGNYDEINKTFKGVPDSMIVENGLGKYSSRANREGIVSYSGTIKLKSAKGKEAIFPFKSEYIVARPALTVAADKMNVVYIGLDNPISVSVPGIPNERLTVTAKNATLKNNGNGKFTLNVNDGKLVDINVTAAMENGEKRNMGTMTFRVKRIPEPSTRIGKIIKSGKMTKNEFQVERGIFADYDSFEFNVICKVLSFEMVYPSRGLQLSISTLGNQITEEMHNVYKKLSKNEKVRFENIKAKGPDGKIVDLSSITLQVN
ncbi:MAG: gliding motility protein GldM [Bacteroidota bacterium]